MPDFEHRDEQVAMAEVVAKACTSDQKLVVEAGTGTGKSLAYLVPLILWATDTGNRVVNLHRHQDASAPVFWRKTCR